MRLETFVTWATVAIVYTGVWVLIAWLFQFAWNYAMPDLFGLPEVSLGQAACVVFLLGFLRRVVTVKTEARP